MFAFRFNLVALLFLATPAWGQNINVGSTSTNIGNSYFYQSGVQWSLRAPNFRAQFGGPPLRPPFGGQAAPGLQTGFGFAGGGVSGSLGLSLAQGSSRSISSTSASVTALDGYPGSISSQTIRPFVTGVTPIVSGGGYGSPTTDNAGQQMFRSHQHAQAAKLNSISNGKLESKQRRAEQAFQRAQRAEASGNLKMARANYRIALRYDQGPLRAQILAAIRAKGW